MSIVDGVRRGVIAGMVAGLAVAPALSAKPFAPAAGFVWALEEPNAFAQSASEQDARDREQEKRDREQEARDREQEKKDREQERLDHLQELYDDAREALDDDKYQQAAEKFSALVQMNGPQTDAALYWKAYAENRQGKRDTALATVAELKRRYPQSRWN
jgi:TolA-binding protein